MHAVWPVLRWLILAVALAPFGFYLLAISSALSFFRRKEDSDLSFAPPVSILKPCRGLDREAYENFASFCRQDYPLYEILFAVGDPGDPVVPVIEQIIRDFPAISIRLIRSVPALGANGKVNKMVRLAQEARYDVLVINDSDIRVVPDYLRRVAAAFRDPAVGAATTMYVARTEGSLGSDLEAVGITSDFHAGVLSAWKLEGVKFALGATMACTRKALEEIGGFEAMVDHHSDDFELGNRIAGKGHRVALLRDPVTITYPRQTMGEFFGHQLRWALTTRFSRPRGHFGLILTFGLPWSLAAAAVAPNWTVAGAYLAGYAVLRLATAWVVGVWGLKDDLLRRKLWLVPVRDAFAFAIWVASYFRTRINWRGSEFYVVGGKLVPVEGQVAVAGAPTATH
jgi:ceramide glucosyltransferase